MMNKLFKLGVLVLSMQTYAQSEELFIRAGSFQPLYIQIDKKPIYVADFWIDKYPVSNAEFFHFVQSHHQWKKEKVSSKMSDNKYLSHWEKKAQGYQPKSSDVQKPVTYVSWYAAQAYCKSVDKKLATTSQWEYVAQASESKQFGAKEDIYRNKILKWYEQSGNKPLQNIGKGKPNFWGVYDMHGLIWEWTLDFDGRLSTSIVRAGEGNFCGAGAAGVADSNDYAAFMRYGFRSSLKPNYTVSTLGFRCAH